MTFFFLIKYLHVLGAIVILGTGSGIAFFMLMAHRSRDAAFVARTAEAVALADMLFTLTALIPAADHGWVVDDAVADDGSLPVGLLEKEAATPFQPVSRISPRPSHGSAIAM